MIFEQIATGGCQSYLVGCADTCAAALIDPEASQIDRYLAKVNPRKPHTDNIDALVYMVLLDGNANKSVDLFSSCPTAASNSCASNGFSNNRYCSGTNGAGGALRPALLRTEPGDERDLRQA